MAVRKLPSYEKLKALRQSGLSAQQIADKYKVLAGTVYLAFRCGPTRLSVSAVIIPDRVLKIWRAQGWSDADIKQKKRQLLDDYLSRVRGNQSIRDIKINGE